MSHARVRPYQPARVMLAILVCGVLQPGSPRARADEASRPLHWKTEAVQRRVEGVMLQRQGDMDGAIAMFQKAAYLDPTYATPHNDLGIAYESLGRSAEAEAEYQACLALDAGYLKAHTNLALLYEQQGRRDLAGYHWLQRHRLGEAHDPWTRVAEEHVAALGLVHPDAGRAPETASAPAGLSRERAAQRQFEHYAELVREYESITDPDGNEWSGRPYTKVTGSQAR